MASPRIRKRQLIAIAAISLLVVMLIALTINIITIFRLKARQEELRRKLSEMNLTAEQIDNELQNRSNPDYIEKYAREKLGLTQDGEKVFKPKKASDN
ncbi:MAG TPA: septum formation initiator family protein [Clostridiales bacterium]|jgi:cell division protein FtsB|nr:septum formation initiator family protein [Clostridiales bacterium]